MPTPRSSTPLILLLACLALGAAVGARAAPSPAGGAVDAEARLEALGITLPPAPDPVANYVNAVRTGNLVFLAGKGPRAADGAELHGKVGDDVTVEQAYEGARLTAVNQLAVLKTMLGDLDRVTRVVKVLGMVNSAPDFVDQPAVINGFSDLIVEVFGERGRHARAAVGMASLPRGQAVEIEMIVEVADAPVGRDRVMASGAGDDGPVLSEALGTSPTNPLWGARKVRNYLPHMTVAEVEAFLERSDLVIIPLGALEQHGDHLPIGTDFINGVERCKLIAQERDVLVAPVLMAGQSPYHMGFAGTIALSAETILAVHLEAVQSLIHHGFRRFIIMNAHGGNRAISTLLVDQINQTTAGVAVSLGDAIAPFLPPAGPSTATHLDRHAGTGETSNGLYLMPDLVDTSGAVAQRLTLPPHLEAMVPDVVAEDPTAKLLFLAEGLKAEGTGKGTSTLEMTPTGVWGERSPSEGTAERGRATTRRLVEATVQFIDRWNEYAELRPAPAEPDGR